MSDLKNRGRALEEKFFHEQEAKALALLRTQIGRENAREALIKHTGITETSVVDGLVAHGLSVETFVALRLIPMVLVAWADGVIQDEELEVMQNFLHLQGVSSDSASKQLLEGWLRKKPESDLEDAWMAFMKAYLPTLSAEDRIALKKEILNESEDVADANGGFFGIGATSSEEREVLNKLSSVF